MNGKTTKPQVNEAKDLYKHVPLTLEDLREDMQERIGVIQNEFIQGLGLIRKHEKSVTFFGSARMKEGDRYYNIARSLAAKIARMDYDVVTGGGPGIMEAANRGAYESDGEGHSLGFNIELPSEQILNPYTHDHISFTHFFARKVALTFAAEAYVYFPGGFGTLDEFFEILTLVQTHKIQSVPLILFGVDFWKSLDEYIQRVLEEEYQTIGVQDRGLYIITDSEEEVIDIIKRAPIREG